MKTTKEMIEENRHYWEQLNSNLVIDSAEDLIDWDGTSQNYLVEELEVI